MGKITGIKAKKEKPGGGMVRGRQVGEGGCLRSEWENQRAVALGKEGACLWGNAQMNFKEGEKTVGS